MRRATRMRVMADNGDTWRLVRATLALSAPVLLALAVLAAAGQLALGPALLAAAASAAGIGGLLHRHVRAMAALRGYVEQLRRQWDSEDELPEPPRIDSPGLDPALARAIADTAEERQARRRELRAAMSGNQAVLAGLPDPLLMIDGQGRAVGANPAAERVFGARLAGRDLATVLRQPELLRAVDAVIAGAAEREVEFTATGEVEQHFSARVARLPEPGPDGALAVCSLHDVTGIRRAERMRADFVANASHELRTPLSSLLGYIETLQGPAKDDAAARDKFLAIMLEQARRMQHLIEDLLSLSRIELDEHTPPEGTADLRRILETVQSSLELRAGAKDMAIRLAIEGDTRVQGDARQLTQVFQNLVDNAIKYGRAGTDIRVEAGPAGARDGRGGRAHRRGLAVSVIDRGEGIARQHLPRLTERFYRVDTARSRELGGTGLGLAIVKHIVSRHRGHIDIDSTPGAGSRFTVHLPSLDAHSHAHTDSDADTGASGQSPARGRDRGAAA